MAGVHFLDAPGTYQPDYTTHLALGHVRDRTPLSVFGRNESVATTEETIWTFGGQYPFPTAAEILNIVSTSADDADQGVGAWSVHIEGLDANWNQIHEDVLLNGLTPVPTTQAYLRVNSVTVTQAGSITGTVGTVNVTNSISLNTLAQIVPENNTSLSTLFTVPAGKAITIYGITGSVDKQDSVSIISYARTNDIANRPKVSKRNFDLYQQYGGTNFPFPYVAPEKTDVWVAAKSSVSTVKVSVIYYAALLPMTHVNFDIEEVGI